MSLQTQHDPKNEAEITYWIALVAAIGSNANNLRTSSLGPILQATLERAQVRQGELSVLSISAAVLVRARSHLPSASALPARCWGLTFQRRCWRAPPSGCSHAPRSNS